MHAPLEASPTTSPEKIGGARQERKGPQTSRKTGPNVFQRQRAWLGKRGVNEGLASIRKKGRPELLALRNRERPVWPVLKISLTMKSSRGGGKKKLSSCERPKTFRKKKKQGFEADIPRPKKEEGSSLLSEKKKKKKPRRYPLRGEAKQKKGKTTKKKKKEGPLAFWERGRSPGHLWEGIRVGRQKRRGTRFSL